MDKRGEPDGFLEGDLNHYALLKDDADNLLRMARETKHAIETHITARTAILLYIISLEALINRVIDDFWPDSLPSVFQDQAKLWQTVKKWELIPEIIAGKKFDKGKQPFQCLKPLFEVRNDYVHTKKKTYQSKVKLWFPKNGDGIMYDPPTSSRYDHIGLMKNPSQWGLEDAKCVKRYCEELVAELDQLLDGNLSKDNWLTSIIYSFDKQPVLIIRRDEI